MNARNTLKGDEMHKRVTEALQDRLDQVKDWPDEPGEETEYRKEERYLREAIDGGVLNKTACGVLTDYSDSWYGDDRAFASAVNHEMAKQGMAERLDPDAVYYPSKPPTFTYKGVKYLKEA
tara:strand:- start:1105 stop:1467 length:363 start_codon:yes stop_codon:yes gene_type:complete